jgi:hypothetical protein
MSACNFVHSAIEELPMIPKEQTNAIQEDIQIMDYSLHFINDLLRNMLDIQRARHHQLQSEFVGCRFALQQTVFLLKKKSKKISRPLYLLFAWENIHQQLKISQRIYYAIS